MDFNPFAYDWEDESTPAHTPKSQSSKEITTTTSPDKIPLSTPKRKRDDNADDTKDHGGTAPKRPSPLRQVYTFDTLDPSTTPSNDNNDIS